MHRPFVLRFAGSMVLLSLLLGHFVSPYWFWFTAFVGANLLQSSFTGFCPLALAAAQGRHEVRRRVLSRGPGR